MLRFYTQEHRFYAGAGLHTRTLHLCILDHTGAVVFDRNLPCRPDAFLQAIAPFRDGLVVGVEAVGGPKLQFGHGWGAVEIFGGVGLRLPYRTPLQFGHGWGAVEIGDRRKAAVSDALASIRPRLRCRGDQAPALKGFDE